MKLKPEQLAGRLKQGIAPGYLVTGDEPLLCEESVDTLRKAFQQQGFTEREVLHVDGSFKWEYLLECASALSLFAERKIIELRLGSQKLQKNASEILQQYLANPAPDNVLLIIADKLDGSAKKSAWFKALDKTGVIVEIWPVEPSQLPGWIRQRAAAMGLSLDESAVELLSERVEGNLLAARQEMSKLQLLYPDMTLGADEVMDAVSDSSRFDIFALTDAALDGQPQRCTRIIQVLRQEGTEAPVLLWALAREIRTLYAVQAGLSQGLPFDTLCQQQRIFGKRKQLVRNCAKRTSRASLEEMLQACAEVDRMIKGAAAGDPWVPLTGIVLHLSGHPLPLRAPG
ncbi:DNA polymerase III subunit delta [Marinobacterium nitratireducens]|uniref:DNA polymerase III subunit delta n=1 Tax=Marinobacterium nitratireducens TaxID=518897 RepID=A0A917ZBS0_9GAMM|nr:DNA polymerase III subunit delta [Marinobacterium nitratireducens]GGO78677.1 DNA polymerase III subunit delta [Marinobacterium nitratireducens]